jgi:hypothetical protein
VGDGAKRTRTGALIGEKILYPLFAQLNFLLGPEG